MRFLPWPWVLAAGTLAACSSSGGGTTASSTTGATGPSTSAGPTGTGGATSTSATTSTGAGATGGGGAASATTSTGPGGAGGAGGACAGADAGPTLDTWSNFAQAFFVTYCVECHDATTADAGGAHDFTQLAGVANEKATIRCGVTPATVPQCGCPAHAFPLAGQFPISDNKQPPNPKPSDADRLRLVAWLDAGLPP